MYGYRELGQNEIIKPGDMKEGVITRSPVGEKDVCANTKASEWRFKTYRRIDPGPNHEIVPEGEPIKTGYEFHTSQGGWRPTLAETADKAAVR